MRSALPHDIVNFSPYFSAKVVLCL